MKQGLIGLLSLLMIAVLTGCGGSTSTEPEPQEEAPAAAPATDEGSGSSTPAEPAPAAEEAAPAEAVPAEAAPVEEAVEAVVETAAEAVEEMKEEATAAAGGLVGSKWEYDGIALEFKEGNKVFLKGGPLAALAPDGTEADYTLDGEKFSVSVLGQTYTGTYDGTKLIVDGKEATMQ